MIGCAPNEAELPENIMSVRDKFEIRYAKLKKQKPKFKPGDLVRISRLKNKFARSYDMQSSLEPFRIHAVVTKFKIPLYILESFDKNEVIRGAFRGHEIIPLSPQAQFHIDKVLKRKNNKLKVNFRGLPKTASFTRWVHISDSPWYTPLAEAEEDVNEHDGEQEGNIR